MTTILLFILCILLIVKFSINKEQQYQLDEKTTRLNKAKQRMKIRQHKKEQEKNIMFDFD